MLYLYVKMIEDIEYLNDHCEKDTATFYVDTNSRNREFFPYPAEFVVDFAQPFKLVNGFDILDAAIPTTMYNIDTSVVDNSFTLVSIPPYSSHDRMTHFQELTTSLIFSNIFETKIETTILVCSEDLLDTYNIQEADKLVSETVITLPHYVAIRRQLFNVPIVKQKNNINATMFYIMFQDNYYSVVNEPQNQAIIDILRDDNYSLTMTAPNVFTVTYFEFYSVSETISTTIISNTEYIILVSNYTKSVEEGNYDVSTLRNDLNAVWNDFGIFVENTTTVERKQGKFKLSSSELIIYNAKKSAMSKSIGFDLLPSPADKANYTPCQVRDNKRIYMGVYQEEEKIYLILAPGIVNLLGERFVILRCKEIEDHLLGSYAYMSYTPGIGLFKLAASYNDITNLRFDFVNLVRKPFHPIGKLHKLTFRFETSAGDLYDFKGVNIQILFMIKFLVPTQKFKFEKSILNPNYDPNFMKYMSTSKNIQYKEDSDNEEEFDNDKYYQMYKKEMDKYDYSSSGDEEGDDDGDSDEESEEEVVLSARRR